MSRQRLLAPTLWFCSLLLLAAPVGAADEFQVLPEKSYRLDLPARKPDETDLTKASRTVAVDVFFDKKSERLIYVGDEGKAVAVVPSVKELGGDGKTAKWHHRLKLAVRKWDEKELDKAGTKIGVEVYRDERAGQWVYVSHTGGLAVLPADKKADRPAKEPTALYRLPMQVRDFKLFELKNHRYNVEVYRDDNTGALVYVSERGALAVIPAGKDDAGRNAEPLWSHAQELHVRKPGEERFDAGTINYVGLEVYGDKNRGAWVYITEGQQLAVVPGANAGELKKDSQPPNWIRGLRPPGEAAKKWSAEVFHNLNTNHLVFVTTGGALSVLPK